MSSARRSTPRPGARGPGARGPAGDRPGQPAQPAAGLRPTVERHSAVVLAWLSLRPRLLLPGLVLALLLVSAVLPGAAGAACLLLVLAVVGWLTYLSWPVLPPRGRVLRVLVVGMLAALVVSRATQ